MEIWLAAFIAVTVVLYAIHQLEQLVNRRFDALEKRLNALSGRNPQEHL